jgi:hypothetical protein
MADGWRKKAGKEGGVMLQAVHQKEAPARASSIYCRWIRENRELGAPLVAVWMDSEMRCFERELSSNAGLRSAHPGAMQEPGEVPLLHWQMRVVHEIEKDW